MYYKRFKLFFFNNLACASLSIIGLDIVVVDVAEVFASFTFLAGESMVVWLFCFISVFSFSPTDDDVDDDEDVDEDDEEDVVVVDDDEEEEDVVVDVVSSDVLVDFPLACIRVINAARFW